MDIRIIDGDFLWQNGDIQFIDDSVVQELTFRLDTYKGEHWFYPDYGTKISDCIGMNNDTQLYYFIEAQIDDALDQDDRIPDRSSTMKVTQDFDKVYVELDVAGRKITKEFGIW